MSDEVTIQTYPYPISDDAFLLSLMVKGDPLPAVRPRFGKRGHVYTDDRYHKYRDQLGWYLKEHMAPLSEACFYDGSIGEADRRFGVRAFFFRKGYQRTDVDNLLKTVLDAGTKIIWPDDSQVLEVYGRVFRGNDDPKVEILIYEVEPEGLTECLHCHKPYKSKRAKTGPAQIFCNQACRIAACAVKRLDGVCEHCHGGFTYPPSLAKNRTLRFCSRGCILRFYNDRRRLNYSPKLCADCGKRVSRPEYIRCFACQLAARRGHASTFKWIKPLIVTVEQLT